MAEDKKHKVDAESYRKYLSGDMTPAEKHAFEKALLDDPFAQEALDGMETLEPKQLQADLKLLETRLSERTHRSQSFIIWRVAAGLLLLGVFSFMVYYFIDNRAPVELAKEKPIFFEKSDTLALSQQSDADTTLPTEPDRIIAYQPPMPEKSAPSPAYDLKAEESQILNDQVPPIEEEADVIIEDQVIEEPVELEEITITGEAVVKETQSLTGAVSAVDASEAEKKKDRAPDARREKANAAEAPASIAAATIMAQERKIRGKVTSVDDDSPAPGVNVIVKGSSTGTVTDIDGNYEVTVPSGDKATLVFTYIGYTTEEIALSPDETVVDVALAADVTSLSEIVVTGYGTSSPGELAPSSYTPPRPIGGQAKFKEYIRSNLRYPESGLAAGIAGSVKVEFVVESNGILTNLQISRGLGEDFDNEALRLIKDGPRWEPAEVNGSKASRKVKITIRFKPPE